MADHPLSGFISAPSGELLPAAAAHAARPRVRPDTAATTTEAPAATAAAAAAVGTDRFSAENTLHLQGALRQENEVRAEVVARARLLAADPNYPPTDVAQKIAELFVIPAAR